MDNYATSNNGVLIEEVSGYQKGHLYETKISCLFKIKAPLAMLYKTTTVGRERY